MRKDASRDEPGAAAIRAVLVANRGEIAVRIIRACHESGMAAVAVYSDADAEARHVRQADSAVRLGPAAACGELPPDRRGSSRLPWLPARRRSIPGYGFLSERAAFARAVEDAGLVFVGPSSAVIDALGDKLHARRVARSVGVDAVPGTLEPAPVDRADAAGEVIAEAEADRLPGDGQGSGRRRGPGHATGGARGRPARGAGRRIGRGPGRVR